MRSRLQWWETFLVYNSVVHKNNQTSLATQYHNQINIATHFHNQINLDRPPTGLKTRPVKKAIGDLSSDLSLPVISCRSSPAGAKKSRHIFLSSQPSSIHQLRSFIFPCSFVCRSAMITHLHQFHLIQQFPSAPLFNLRWAELCASLVSTKVHGFCQDSIDVIQGFQVQHSRANDLDTSTHEKTHKVDLCLRSPLGEPQAPLLEQEPPSHLRDEEDGQSECEHQWHKAEKCKRSFAQRQTWQLCY